MNILMQMSGLIMLICLLYFVLRQKTVGLYTEKVFFRTLVISTLCVSFDILSIIAIHYHEIWGEGVVKFICKTYIVTLVCVAFSSLYYVFADIYGERYYRKAALKYNYTTGISCLLIYLLPIEYVHVHEGQIVYTQGPSVLVTYAAVLFLISVTLCYVIMFKSKMHRKRARAVTVWMCAWLLAAIIQFLNSELLLVGFASALGMMILFISLENPEANIDRTMGCFTSHALLAYVKQCYLLSQDFSAVLISLSYTVKNDEEFEYIEQFLKQDDRVLVYFQPIYSVKEQKFVSAEALVRIEEKDGSIMPPVKFIPVAEETGMVAKLGERVFEKTCEFIRNHKLLELGVDYIEINLSVVQCQNRNLAEKFIQIIEKYQISPTSIMLEITETASIHAKKILLKNMEQLMNYGVSFALDDFGNGNSNLDYLIDMPVDILKLDQNMTKAYFNKMKAKHVVDAMNSMVHDMGLKIVAEGIETKEQLEVMEKLGIDYIQGYYFSKPLPVNVYLEFLAKQKHLCREGQ